MRKISIIYIVGIVVLGGCSIHNTTGTTPTQNKNLNAVSPVGDGTKDKKGFLQRSYDRWEQEEWEPNTETQTADVKEEQPHLIQEQQKVSETSSDASNQNQKNKATAAATGKTEEINASETFQLQYYVDKWGRYIEKKEQTEANQTAPSNVERLDAMPGIGK